jgi:hypothetical protein
MFRPSIQNVTDNLCPELALIQDLAPPRKRYISAVSLWYLTD